jgi:NitT/TauT family transport system permease protein
MIRQSHKIHWAPLIIAFLVLSIWEVIVRMLKVPAYLLPPPTAILTHGWQIRGSIASDLAVTTNEAFLGFIVGVISGIGTATLFLFSRTAERGLYPFAIALKTIPIVAIAPLLTIWFGFGLLSKTIMVSLICYFPALVNSLRGFRSLSPEINDYLLTLAVPKLLMFRKVRLFWSLPYMFAGMKIASTFAVLGAVVGEFAGANAGLGYAILMGSYRNETITIFANVIAASALGILFFHSVSWLERIVVPWQTENKDEV